MAVYSTFFLCSPEELSMGFPGWKFPLEEPVRREVKNPFTGELMVVESRVPDWPDEVIDTPPQEYKVVSFKGKYEDYLEDRLPPFVRGCKHWAAKGLTQIDLDPLLEACGVSGSLEEPIYGPPSTVVSIFGFPQEFPAKLAALDLNATAAKWAVAMSSPAYTHSRSGVKLSDGWTTDYALEFLQPIAALTQSATSTQRLYLLTG